MQGKGHRPAIPLDCRNPPDSLPMNASVPVIAIDGPTASGKGTVAQRVARALGFHYLDSGALYRLVALLALERGVAADDADRLAQLAATMRPRFDGDRIELDGRDVTDAIRTEEVSAMASCIAVHPPLRAALLALQKSFRRPPGLVADGRDMGTVVFPDARLKVYLTASVQARTDRRYKQLIEKGIPANIGALSQDLRARDARDSGRSTAPLTPAKDAYQLDTSALAIDEVVARILDWYRRL
ncbi:MAG: cytidylate kinase CmK [Burkholderiaceae bacterium]